MKPGGQPSAVFLHTGWRSAGTWIWARFRENPRVRAFYEPLHEGLAHFRREDIGQFRPGSWKSGHSSTGAYFAEYETLLNPSGRGVRGYQRDFAFEHFFLPPDAENPALEAYLRSLVRAAHDEGRLPVLKFCRSLGRVEWLRQRFPDAAHITVLRDPGPQWCSAREQYEQHGNRYFLVAPFAILSRNAEDPMVKDASTRLDVTLPPRFGRDLKMTVDACWRHVSRLSWDDRYRGFLALWAAAHVAALRAGTALIDSTVLMSDAGYRRDVAHMIEAETRMAIGLEADPTRLHADASNLQGADADMALANHAATGFIAAWRHTLPAAHAALIMRKLVEAPGLQALMDLPNLEERPKAKRPPLKALSYVDAVAYILLLRLTFPLRRLHGTLDRLRTERQAARLAKTQAIN
jgi:hypothetical protein